jgi:hypothetical protein
MYLKLFAPSGTALALFKYLGRKDPAKSIGAVPSGCSAISRCRYWKWAAKAGIRPQGKEVKFPGGEKISDRSAAKI